MDKSGTESYLLLFLIFAPFSLPVEAFGTACLLDTSGCVSIGWWLSSRGKNNYKVMFCLYICTNPEKKSQNPLCFQGLQYNNVQWSEVYKIIQF